MSQTFGPNRIKAAEAPFRRHLRWLWSTSEQLALQEFCTLLSTMRMERMVAEEKRPCSVWFVYTRGLLYLAERCASLCGSCTLCVRCEFAYIWPPIRLNVYIGVHIDVYTLVYITRNGCHTDEPGGFLGIPTDFIVLQCVLYTVCTQSVWVSLNGLFRSFCYSLWVRLFG